MTPKPDPRLHGTAKMPTPPTMPGPNPRDGNGSRQGEGLMAKAGQMIEGVIAGDSNQSLSGASSAD